MNILLLVAVADGGMPVMMDAVVISRLSFNFNAKCYRILDAIAVLLHLTFIGMCTRTMSADAYS